MNPARVRHVRQVMRHRLLATLGLVLLAGTSTARAQDAGKPVPPTDDLRFAPAPRPVEVVSGHAVVAAQIDARSAQLATCTPRTRATFARARVTLRWNGRGEVRAVAVGGPGGATFARCVRRALRGTLVAPPVRGGSGSAVVIIRRTVVRAPAPPPVPAPDPTPIAGSSLERCSADADCVVHFREQACFPGDPIAVNQSDMAAVRAAFPVRRLDCAMGGPQYMEQRMANEGRYSAACERTMCVVRDAGPRPTRPF